MNQNNDITSAMNAINHTENKAKKSVFESESDDLFSDSEDNSSYIKIYIVLFFLCVLACLCV